MTLCSSGAEAGWVRSGTGTGAATCASAGPTIENAAASDERSEPATARERMLPFVHIAAATKC